jgi:hypothetical protein
MNLKFHHRWKRVNGSEFECVTTLAAHVASRISQDDPNHNRKDLAALVEQANERELKSMLYDLPREEFYRAYMDLMKNIQPVWGSDFEQARVRLFEFAGQLTKTNKHESSS